MSGDQGDESSHRERAAYLFCRAKEQSAPEGRASAAPRRGGGDAATLKGAAASDSPPSVMETISFQTDFLARAAAISLVCSQALV